MSEAINSGNHFWYAIKRWRHRDKSWSNYLQLGEDGLENLEKCMGPFISVHVLHYMHYVGLRQNKYLIGLEETWIIF